MASLDEILSATKNISLALSQNAQAMLNTAGQSSVTGIAAATLVKSGQGRLVIVIVTTASSATGAIYDVSVATSTANLIYTIPATVGVYPIGIAINYGIVVAPGSGMTVAVGYS